MQSLSLKFRMKLFVRGILAVLIIPVCLFGGTVSLEWNANTEQDLAGYKIYYGTTSGYYSTIIDVGDTTEYDVPDMTPGETYYFALTAYDEDRNESLYSTEISCVVNDVDPPAISSVLCDQEDLVKVVFSESVEENSAEVTSNYAIDNGIAVSAAVLQGDGKTVHLTTTLHSIDDYILTVNNVRDLSSNTIAANSQAGYSYDDTDNTPPAIVGASLISDYYLALTFSEPLNRNSALNKNNYSISPALNIIGIGANDSTTIVYLTTASHAPGQSYSASVVNVTDNAGNPIAANSQRDYQCNSSDVTPPQVIAARLNLSANSVEVEFNEVLNDTSAITISHYSIAPNVPINSAILNAAKKKVTLGTNVHASGNYTLTVTGVRDTSNNAISSVQMNYICSLDDIPPTLDSLVVISDDFLEVFFSEPLKQSTAENINNYSITPITDILSATLNAGQKKVLLHTDVHAGGNYRITINGIQDQAQTPNTIAANSYKDYSYTPPDFTAPKLRTVTLLGDNLVKLVFTEALDRTTSENITHYSINPVVTIQSASLVGDSLNIVYLTTTAHTAGQTYSITINNIQDRAPAPNTIAANTVETYEYPLIDNTPPGLISATLQGSCFLELGFNEAVDQTTAEIEANYSISPTINIVGATLDVSGTKIFLKTEDHQAGTQYTVTVQNIKDRANPANMISVNNQLTYQSAVQDNTPPSFVRAEIMGNVLVELQFSEPLNETSALQPSNYSINNGISIQTISLGQLYKNVYLTTSPHQRGTYTVSVSNVADLAGNAIQSMKQQNYTYTPVDSIAPRLAYVELSNETTLELLFNEPLDQASAEIIGNYQINNSISITRARLDVNMTGVILQTSSHVPGTYILTLNGIKDASAAKNFIAPNSVWEYTYSPVDNTPPVLVSAELQNEKKLLVTFSESLDPASAYTMANYKINNNITVTDVLSHSDGKVILETSDHTPEEYTLTVNGLKDASPAKNIIASYSQIQYIYNPPDSTGPSLLSAVLHNENYLELTFDEALDPVESQNKNNFEITPPVQIQMAILGTTGDKVGLLTASHNPESYTVTVSNVTDRAFQPNPITSQNTASYAYVPPDTLPPRLVSLQMSSPMLLTLIFDEELTGLSAENTQNYTITPNITVHQASLLQSRTTVHLETSGHQVNTTYTIQIQGLEDRSSNHNRIVIPIVQQYSYTPPDTTAPELLTVKLHGSNLLELIFSEAVEKSTAEDRTNYMIEPFIEVYEASQDTSNLMKVFLQTSSHMPGRQYGITVENVKDRAPIPNTIKPNQYINYSMPSSGGQADVTPPEVARVDILSATKVDVVFTEPVDKGTAELESNYSIIPDITVIKALLDSNQVRVHLTTSEHQEGKSYRIHVTGIYDQAYQPNVLQSNGPVNYLLASGASLSNLSQVNYAWRSFHVGDTCYVDRDYTIEQIPQYLDGVIQIQTANDDKQSTGNAHLSFELKGEGTVYIARDKRIKDIPSWLSGWKVTGDQVVNSRSGAYHLYSKDYKEGKVVLGGNYGTIDDNMYMVFVIPQIASKAVLSNLSKSSYEPEHVAVGDEYYIDRDYTITSIPESMERLLWIKTANDDKECREEIFLTFKLNAKSKIFIGHDARIASLPKWLNDWQITDEQIIDSRGTEFDIYCKEFTAGDIILGGNCGGAEDNMYLILIKPLEGQGAGDSNVPGFFTLKQNYPNPFNPETRIEYIIQKSGHINITVFNILGQKVKELVNDYKFSSTTPYEVVWKGDNESGTFVASGVYFYRIVQGQYSRARRMLLLR